MASSVENPSDVEGLRGRHVPAPNGDKSEAEAPIETSDDAPKERKTVGRTPDNTVFTVPQTHDMVSQLFDIRQPKNLSDAVVIAVLALHVCFLYILPSSLKRPVFAFLFLFWRTCYNGGIGYLLHVQSNHQRLVNWAKKYQLFENPATGKNPRPWLYKLLKSEMQTKIPEDYKFEEAPIEYNTWLVFRRVVDLILMCDFVSYCLFALACAHRPAGEGPVIFILRWMAGLLLFFFNIWVKLDAHRVVKDYAWYWGDFFYLVDQQLTFDGVFEMAPHPMYSVGYAGFYGISLMAASYSVLAISVIGHAAQFFFLVYVENPHIEKTYNSPAPRKRPSVPTPDDGSPTRDTVTEKESTPETVAAEPRRNSYFQPSEVHNLMGITNVDLCRNTDVSVLLLQAYVFLLAIMTPSTPLFQTMFVIHAIAWRLWYSVGLGVILDLQSRVKGWTRHFLKYGDSHKEAWRQWKGMYHLSMTMCYASFIAACYKSYHLPTDWNYGLALFKHVVGAGLVALQVWTAVSIYDSLGEFGWFFGDFFWDHCPKLTYGGIYRYLNNPERIIGLAGIWGAVFITSSPVIFFLALLSHMLTLAFIQFVEKPHMEKLYGRNLRREAGITKTIKRSLPEPLKQWQGSVDRAWGETGQFIEDFFVSAKPMLANGVTSIIRDTSSLFNQYPARLTITRLAPDLAGFDPKDYSLSVSGTPSSSFPDNEKSSGKEGIPGRLGIERRSDFTPLVFEYGAPLTVTWTAPVAHSRKDWIGLYMVAENNSREVTRVSSAGRWIPCCPNEWDDSSADCGIISFDQLVSGVSRQDGSKQDFVRGEMRFEGDKLWWTHGVFEFRYHHDGKHNVMAISQPFEIRLGRFVEDEHADTLSLSPTRNAGRNNVIRAEVEKALLPVVRNCFDRDPEIAPSTVEEQFGTPIERDGKYARRVVWAVREMFGIEFAPGVVRADGNVRNLAWRIVNAKQVLAPYSMSAASRGTSTPMEEEEEVKA